MRRSDDLSLSLARYAVIVLCLCATITSHAQNAAQFTLWGDNATRAGDHYGASRFYGEALQQESGRLELQWKFAEACRLCNRYPEAAEAYDKVQRKDLGRAHPTALRWLGEMQLCAGRYEEARKTWQKVKQKEKDKSSVVAQRADNALKGIELALGSIEADSVDVEHLPEPVNSYDSEFGARVGPDSSLYFSSLRGELKEDGEVVDTMTYRARILLSRYPSPSTVPPHEALARPNAHVANCAWSLDGRWQYFTLCPDGRPCRIMAQRDEVTVPLKGLDTSFTNTQPMVTRMDGHEVLLFTTDHSGGKGGLDIWQARLYGDAASQVEPISTGVNTPGNECTPFHDASGSRLLFSSDFLPGFGGYDLFSSVDVGEGMATPVNMGAPFNSAANDLYPAYYSDQARGFFTSNRIGSLAHKGETCCNDIYSWTVKGAIPTRVTSPALKDTATLAQRRITSLREKLPIRLYFHNDEPDPRTKDTLTRYTYEQTYHAYKALVPAYHKAWGANTEGITAIDAFFQDRVDHGFDQLNQFIELLEQALSEGQHIALQVRGFASPLAKSDYNANLSLRRISSLMNYLRTVQGGRLTPYLESKALTIIKSPFGEDQSASGISDQLEDLQGSVYSVGASMERRIEIEQVLETVARTSRTEQLILEQSIDNLRQLQHKQIPFVIKNTGPRPLRLLSMRPDCDCTLIQELPKDPIPAGGETKVIVEFNGRGPEGPLSKGVTITTDGEPHEIRLVISGFLKPFEP